MLTLLGGNPIVIDRAIGIAGLAFAVVSPVLPIMFPNIGRRWAWGGFIVGVSLMGIAVGILFVPVNAQTSGGGGVTAPGNSGIITQGQSGGTNIVNQKPSQRHMTPELVEQILRDVPKDKPVTVTAPMGNDEAITFAQAIFDLLKARGYPLTDTGPGQAMWNHPVKGVIFDINKREFQIGSQ
jgi:hypothetical protein